MQAAGTGTGTQLEHSVAVAQATAPLAERVAELEAELDSVREATQVFPLVEAESISPLSAAATDTLL